MKEICLLIVLTHLAFPAFENAFKFQYLGSNLPNIQDSVQISQNKKSVSLILPFGQPYFWEGISIYSKVNWKINDSNSLSFRYSIQRKKEISEKWKPEMGLQLDIVF